MSSGKDTGEITREIYLEKKRVNAGKGSERRLEQLQKNYQTVRGTIREKKLTAAAEKAQEKFDRSQVRKALKASTTAAGFKRDKDGNLVMTKKAERAMNRRIAARKTLGVSGSSARNKDFQSSVFGTRNLNAERSPEYTAKGTKSTRSSRKKSK